MKKGNLIILAARPAMGKTTLALNIIANLCQEGKSVIFYSLEMTAEEIYKKLISCTSKISIAEARRQLAKDNQTKNNTFDENVVKSRNKESEAFWKRLQNGLDTVYKWNLEIIDKGSFEISDLKIASKVWKKKGGLDLLVIDYLQLMTARGHENRTAEVTAITKGLKDLAKSLDIPVLALAQLNREVEGRQNKKPTKADLRESGSIEQDADVVMLIYRDRYYNKNGDPWTEVIIDKNRVGENSTARLEFYPAISKFYEYKGFSGQTVQKKQIEGVFK
jgi:replicative DNA helicase